MSVRYRARVTAAAHALCAVAFTSGVLAAAVNDDVVQNVLVQGNKQISTAQIQSVMSLKSGGALTRSIVLADVERIEALYRKRGHEVAIATDLTHPGEHEGSPVTTMTFTIDENSRPPPPSTSDDPLEVYYSNTLVCAAAKTLNDLCHLWLNRDGSFINFDIGEAKTGHYTVGPVRADGKATVCQYWDNPDLVSPPELRPQMGPPPPAANAAAGSTPAPPAGVMICRNDNNRTTCLRGVDPATLSDADKKLAGLSMGARWHLGMCYPIGPHQVGDIWFEADDPLPGQLGMDRVLLIKGRQ